MRNARIQCYSRDVRDVRPRSCSAIRVYVDARVKSLTCFMLPTRYIDMNIKINRYDNLFLIFVNRAARYNYDN